VWNRAQGSASSRAGTRLSTTSLPTTPAT
jgi:hypothetical protein